MPFKKLHIEITPLLILYFGAVSTAGGGFWLWLQDKLLRETDPLSAASVLRAGLEELILSAVLHVILAAVIALHEKTKERV